MRHGPFGTEVRALAVGLATALAAMVVLQVGAALSKPAMEAHGALQITWLRLFWASVLVTILVRPKLRTYSAVQWRTAFLLGAAMALVNIGFYLSLLTIPIGVATSIEFLGPLAVAAYFVVRTRASAVVSPILAAIGVFMLTGAAAVGVPSAAAVSGPEAIGIGWAALAALGWGAYVVFMKRTGHLFPGLEGLAVSLSAATLVCAPVALAASGGAISVEAAGTALALAILVPLVPYALEMIALRRMDARVFGMFTSVEPVVAVVVGLLLLDQVLTLAQLAGVALVTLAMVRVMQLQVRDG